MRLFSLLEKAYGPLQWQPRLDPVSELVFTILSQHTSDLNAERCYRQLLTRFANWETVAQAQVAEIEGAIRSGGLARQKASRISNVLRLILDRRGSFDLSFLAGMPLSEAKAWLRQFPGVGPKTAAVVLAFSLGMPAMPVDTHVFRVSKRLGLLDLKTSVEAAHDLLESLIPPRRVYPFHVYLITHGRRVCKAPRPRCDMCILASLCPSLRSFLPQLPNPGRRIPPKG
ncbi:MAG: endonuclease III [Chloroflexi bacterium]|nr:endonuclease III [Chloroflexota bacterium]